MKRQYTHIKILESEIIKMREQGKTRQEIADTLGLTKTQIKNWVYRHTREPEVFIPKRRGRPRKTPPTQQYKMELHIRELEREVDLYRSKPNASTDRKTIPSGKPTSSSTIISTSITSNAFKLKMATLLLN